MIVGSNPSTAFYNLIYQVSNEQKAQFEGLFYFSSDKYG
ncbi:UDP-N-acetylglucosamine 1-carboxyvinyltransferase [Streptococcus pseudopneumoniae]|uniref:UDP-N-acetylglucosamine 1-carboxyvinyltransferase n=1 Tax=Streptococcus pseudopneumoniae TaxID=257758 RepID=A0A1S9Z688_9STRE|nr:UDP-N-acetylglucosamine 1-carboxyvinyltransferase [Streptococcus pseudopneumoniae]ORC36180.1 UDP-N-acetylglucosamine 1-carboxyvinyltransferase [Streptococcus pseudopneumoniae ATCC BAA-960 = CCUG 49455]NIB73392.1 UDP-N-acetylglucosamine 1-carboxyvinyltransferase [Streptococcus pseudopneumoniae]NIB75415.1 UDP-N-acetylglucosamine 1-carboxyvinyltransferase [Streptococcus pseudopneumoniae]NIB77231.1 UDP-N-acetylglucosamine 1-carboxyvinyltransferase [Streptococcus pseudopneumoniae]